jgi:hypothetical protein
MQRFLGFLVILAIVVLAAGYYLDWFKFSSSSSGNNSTYQMQVDKSKIETDTEKAKQKLQDTAKDVKERFKPASSEPAKDNSSPPPGKSETAPK